MTSWMIPLVLTWLASPEPQLRRVNLAGNGPNAHAVLVTGAPNLATTLRFSDTFAADAVSCGGSCVEVGALKADGAAQSHANWIVDLRPKERTIHLWPSALPSAHNPVSAFTSNLFVGLDGGEMVNVGLRLLDPARANMVADAVVDISVAAERSAYVKRQANRGARKDEREGDNDLARYLTGPTHCRKIVWARPHRHMRLVVRLRQLCHVPASGLSWATLEVENRSTAPIHLASARLMLDLPDDLDASSAEVMEIETEAAGQVIPAGHRESFTVAAVAAKSTNKNKSWSISVESQSPRNERVVIRDTKFF